MTIAPSRPFEIGQLSAEVLAQMDQRAADYEQEHVDRKIALQQYRFDAATEALWRLRGKRYQRCTLDNFEASTPEQRNVLAMIRIYSVHILDRIEKGVNILLNGNPGTGKDHLLAGLMHCALAKQKIVKWTCGTTLFRRLRDRIDYSDASEEEILRLYTRPDVLVISDPARKDRVLTDHQQDKLYEIIDRRYNDCQPIWVTLNAADGKEAERMIGWENVDRLRHGGLSLSCDWESYRKAMK